MGGPYLAKASTLTLDSESFVGISDGFAASSADLLCHAEPILTPTFITNEFAIAETHTVVHAWRLQVAKLQQKALSVSL